MSKSHIETTPPEAGKPEIVYQDNYLPVMLQNMGRDDEISLIDLWLVLARRKWLILLVMSVSVLLALFYVMNKPDVYRYFASLEIGVMPNGDKRVFLEQPQSVLAKLEKSYIPEVLSKYESGDNEYKVEASLGQGTHIITVQGKAVEDEVALYQQMITEIINKIYLDHQRISELHKKEIDLAKSRTQNQLTRLKDDAALLLSQEKRIEEKVQLLQQRIADIKRSLQSAEQTRQQAAKNVTTEGKALALLMMDNDIQSRADRLAGLEEELIISIDNEREVIANRILDNRRKQTEVLEQLDKLDIQQANLLETRALSSPMQSHKPVGTGKKLVLIVALFAGLFLGVFAAFFTEFLSKVREYQVDSPAKSVT